VIDVIGGQLLDVITQLGFCLFILLLDCCARVIQIGAYGNLTKGIIREIILMNF